MPASDLSVIISSVNSYTDLKSCLSVPAAQQSAVVEVIVVDRLGADLHGFPDTTLLPVPTGTIVPEMRAAR